MKKAVVLSDDPLHIFNIDVEENTLSTMYQKSQRRVVLLKVPLMLRLLDINVVGNTIETVYQKDEYNPRLQIPVTFSSRYEITFSKRIDVEKLLTDELEVKLISLYNALKNKQRHPVLVKYILYYYSMKTNIPLYKLPIQRVVYSNENRSERELSVNAVIKATYRLLPLFEKI